MDATPHAQLQRRKLKKMLMKLKKHSEQLLKIRVFKQALRKIGYAHEED